MLVPEASPPRTSPPAPPRSGAPQRRDASLRVPLWLRWVLSLAAAAALLFGLVHFVQTHSSDSPAPENPAAAAQQNRETEVLVAQDQAPHSVRLKPGAVPAAALQRAIGADMNFLIDHQVLDGPLQSSKCTRTGPRSSTRLAFSCRAVADNVNYPFLGVVEVRSRQLTYCKRDPAPIPSENIPLSPRCLG